MKSVLIAMICLNVGFVLGCCHRSRHVDHRQVVPADPTNVHRLPSWHKVPRPGMEREA